MKIYISNIIVLLNFIIASIVLGTAICFVILFKYRMNHPLAKNEFLKLFILVLVSFGAFGLFLFNAIVSLIQLF